MKWIDAIWQVSFVGIGLACFVFALTGAPLKPEIVWVASGVSLVSAAYLGVRRKSNG
jgi:hypothetical protein